MSCIMGKDVGADMVWSRAWGCYGMHDWCLEIPGHAYHAFGATAAGAWLAGYK